MNKWLKQKWCPNFAFINNQIVCIATVIIWKFILIVVPSPNTKMVDTKKIESIRVVGMQKKKEQPSSKHYVRLHVWNSVQIFNFFISRIGKSMGSTNFNSRREKELTRTLILFGCWHKICTLSPLVDASTLTTFKSLWQKSASSLRFL